MPAVPIAVFEIRERMVVETSEGLVVTKVFYLDPYEAHPVVLAALLGGIDVDDQGRHTRRKPAHDSYIPWAYCVQAELHQPNLRQMAAGPSLGYVEPKVQPVDTALQMTEVRRSIQDTQEIAIGAVRNVPDPRTVWSQAGQPTITSNAGCWIRAVYKPLICEQPPSARSLDVDEFDLVDPQIVPITRTISCNKGLKYWIIGALSYSDVGSEGVITVPMEEFTVRRLMCPTIPRTTISRLKGKVNESEFRLGNYTFAAQCLRFDDADVIKRSVAGPDGQRNEWYDIAYKFTHQCTWADAYDNDAQQFFRGYVTWNRIFGIPLLPFLGLPVNLQGGQLSTAQMLALAAGGPVALAAQNLVGGLDTPISWYPVGWKGAITGDYQPLYPTEGDVAEGAPGIPQGEGVIDGFWDLFKIGSP